MNNISDEWALSQQLGDGWIVISGNRYFVTASRFVFSDPGEDQGDCELSREVRRQIQAYLDDPRFEFDLPVVSVGNDFQQKIWQTLESIRPGETWTYGQLAEKLGTSAQAVGGACGRNPVALLIPCHRVVGKNTVGGFAGKASGDEVGIKQWLLQHENHD